MATASAPATSLLSLLYRSYPTAISSNSTELDLSSITPKLFPKNTYSDAEGEEITQWIAKSTDAAAALKAGNKSGVDEVLNSLNAHLATRTTILGAKPSVADVAVYAILAPEVEKWTPEERTGEKGYHHIVRHVDFVQNAPLFGLQIPEEEKITIDVDDVKFVLKPLDPKAEKERKKKEKEAAQAAEGKPLVVGKGKGNNDKGGKGVAEKAGEVKDAVVGAVTGKREKKEKQPKQPKAQPAAAAPRLSPSVIDLRVGHILRAIQHPNADSLYVSTIACGDAPGTENTVQDEVTGLTVRTVCSGLNGLVPLAEMQGRKVAAVCNLKPVTMRGIKSCAMVLAASPREENPENPHGGPVEVVSPPADAEAGERLVFNGFDDGEPPEKVLNPKKKVWESFQPGFLTTEDLEVGFDASAVPLLQPKEGEASTGPKAIGKLVTKSGGVCTVKSLKGATVR
ncbi:G4 quadruplex nucleic acid binding protein [Arachnomyces sp. PD_36]|nr:G4 quadruplex nucleic acid binding protein [Arachnomyces sp. PD_36]